MSAQDLALSISQQSTADRLQSLAVEVRPTFTVSYGGYSPDRGLHYGSSEGSTVYFTLDSGAAIGEKIEVTRPKHALYGRGAKL